MSDRDLAKGCQTRSFSSDGGRKRPPTVPRGGGGGGGGGGRPGIRQMDLVFLLNHRFLTVSNDG